MNARQRAEALFTVLKQSSLLFEETGWMNHDDMEAVLGPMTDTIQKAMDDAIGNARRTAT